MMAAMGRSLAEVQQFPETAVVEGSCGPREAILRIRWYNFDLNLRFTSVRDLLARISPGPGKSSGVWQHLVGQAEGARTGISSSYMWEMSSVDLLCNHNGSYRLTFGAWDREGRADLKERNA